MLFVWSNEQLASQQHINIMPSVHAIKETKSSDHFVCVVSCADDISGLQRLGLQREREGLKGFQLCLVSGSCVPGPSDAVFLSNLPVVGNNLS